MDKYPQMRGQLYMWTLHLYTYIYLYTHMWINLHIRGFPDSWVGKESTCNAGDPSSIPGSGRSAGEGIGCPRPILGLPWRLSWERICLQSGRPGFYPWVGTIPCRRPPTPVFWPGEFHGLYSPLGHKESDMTEWLALHFTSWMYMYSHKLTCLLYYGEFATFNHLLKVQRLQKEYKNHGRD